LKYAAYGSNLHPLRLQERTDHARLLGTTRVDGFALRFHKRGNIDGSAKCNIVDQAGCEVYVAVFEISKADVEQLDIAEGVGTGYDRTRIEIPNYGRCMTYRAQSTHIDDSLLPFGWYKALVLAGCRFHRFPHEYLEAIDNMAAVTDPDPERHALHMSLLSTLN
jgi:gamma-glutamylcyclotransferase (GGCT)/AIG2-like uncharacterized protein YtfP